MCNGDERQKHAEPGLRSPSSSRPPQLNQTVCGCRCGRGSSRGNGTDDDAGPDEDEALTLVASDASDDGSDISPGEFIIREDVANFHGMQPDSPGSTVASSSDRSRTASSYSGTAESMENEAGSGVHSVLSSDYRSVHCMSPGPGLGAWTEELPLEYHFLARPLRLTPQHQYCRGVVASHLVLNDEQFCDV